ncbi:hypothetical protein CLV36_1315 [Laceyella sediminis]|uniref:Uncharacterized protein n=1 Tax=Laceyella sediminis TaxID=573074 RepID=A0ABX5EJA4_9BACL|nr:hypothetical protein [Laceyella sediminis]PRZ11638.1 hypothetical protein CLV36_1315 [Laceyella sediminis]
MKKNLKVEEPKLILVGTLEQCTGEDGNSTKDGWGYSPQDKKD